MVKEAVMNEILMGVLDTGFWDVQALINIMSIAKIIGLDVKDVIRYTPTREVEGLIYSATEEILDRVISACDADTANKIIGYDVRRAYNKIIKLYPKWLSGFFPDDKYALIKDIVTELTR